MNITLGPETSRLLKERMQRGGYDTPDEVILAALASLQQQDKAAEGFEPGEMEKLLAVADAEIERGEVLDGEEVFRELRQLRKNQGSRAG